jgi:hypothetical protein
MEDNINILKVKDNINILKVEDNLHFLNIGINAIVVLIIKGWVQKNWLIKKIPYILSPGDQIFKILVSSPIIRGLLWGVDTNILKIQSPGLEM